MQVLRNKLMYKIAKAYYDENLTQQMIGNKYGISRIMVSRLLKKALKEKIVEIKISSPIDPNVDIEKLLEKKFGLNDVLIVSCNSTDNEKIISELGKTAAVWLMNRLEGTETISLSWGKTLLSLIDNLPKSKMPNMEVVQMTGGLGVTNTEAEGAGLTLRMANILNSKARLLNSPGIVSSKIMCDALREDLQIRETLRIASKANIAIMGIGKFDVSSNIFTTNIILSDEDKKHLISNNANGDICLQFFDSEGKMVSDFLNERIVGLSIEEILKIPHRIGIAGGKNKFETILAACKGGLINVLITDEVNGRRLLKD